VCKKLIKHFHPFRKKCQKTAGGGDFLTHTVQTEMYEMSRKVAAEQYKWCCYCRRCWLIFQWRCWRQFSWGHSWCCIRLTLRLVTTAVCTNLACPSILSVELSFCWPQSARPGITHWPAGQTHRLVCGSGISWRSWLNVSRLSTLSLLSCSSHSDVFVIVEWRETFYRTRGLTMQQYIHVNNC